MVDDLVQNFIEEKLLDDEGYVRGMVTSLRRQGKSRRVILGKLQQKQVPAEDIEKTLGQFDEDHFDDPREAELVSALKIARKRKLGAYDSAKKYEYEKALNILARQGFSFDTSRRVLEMNKDEIHEIESNQKLY